MTEKLPPLATTGSTRLLPAAPVRRPGKTGGDLSVSAAPEKTARLRKACEDMESLFVHRLIKEMRATVPKSGLFGKSQARDIYTGMLDGQLAREISQSHGLGISTLLMRQLGGGKGPADENSQ